MDLILNISRSEVRIKKTVENLKNVEKSDNTKENVKKLNDTHDVNNDEKKIIKKAVFLKKSNETSEKVSNNNSSEVSHFKKNKTSDKVYNFEKNDKFKKTDKEVDTKKSIETEEQVEDKKGKSKEKIKSNKKDNTKKKASLVMDTDYQIKDMEAFLGSSKGTKYESVFSTNTFAKFSELHPHLVKTLADRMNITILTSIQEKAIPALLEGRDALIKSSTGSGKTLSYAIPMVNSLQAIQPPINRSSGIHAIILLPTRELAIQTQDVLTKITNPFVRIVTGTMIGGEKVHIQKRSLRKGLNILIATPNRLLHHFENSKLDLQNLKWLVIDEADRISELGFADNMKKVVEKISLQKSISLVQTVLLSATLSGGVENLAGLVLNNPIRAEVDFIKTEVKEEEKAEKENIKSKEERVQEEENEEGVQREEIVQPKEDEEELKGEFSNFAMPSGLQHFVLLCPTKLRMVALVSFLLLKCKYGKKTGKVVVFLATQNLVEFHFQLFTQFLKEKSSLEELPNSEENKLSQNSSGMEIFQLHGGMEHDKRQAVFKNFSGCKNGFLLTTDICSRGVDMAGVSWVVQYHPPGSPVEYIHRVGRTARAGNSGKALLFLAPSESNYVEHLRASVGGLKIEKVALASVLRTALSHAGQIKQRRAPIHTVEESIFLTAKILEEHVSNDSILQNLARSAFKSLVSSYATFSKEMRRFFCYKDLHLGHVAKSLACKEKPTEIVQLAKRNVASEIQIDKRKKMEEKSNKRKSSTLSKENGSSKKPKMDQAHRFMMAEFGL